MIEQLQKQFEALQATVDSLRRDGADHRTQTQRIEANLAQCKESLGYLKDRQQWLAERLQHFDNALHQLNTNQGVVLDTLEKQGKVLAGLRRRSIEAQDRDRRRARR